MDHTVFTTIFETSRPKNLSSSISDRMEKNLDTSPFYMYKKLN